MTPLYKLEKLPRTQKLRKIEKVFSMAEIRFLNANKTDAIFTESEFIFFRDAAKLLACDPDFSSEARIVFLETAEVFNSVKNVCEPMLRRALNNIKHLLLLETGRDQADWDFITESGQLDSAKRQIFEGMCLYLEDIRSPFNVGAIFRTAESFGVEKIFLSSFCADPKHRRAERTAMGCIDIVPWERKDFFAPQPCNEPPLPVFALETGGIPINEFNFPKKGILIAGSEELGVSPLALEAADASLGRVSIPTYGAKASLNVTTAVGIALSNWVKVVVSCEL